jgi:hypothetical protein
MSSSEQFPTKKFSVKHRNIGFNRLGKRIRMLGTLFAALLVLWLLGMVTSYTMGGFIHILLVLAIVVLVIRIVQGRRIAS